MVSSRRWLTLAIACLASWTGAETAAAQGAVAYRGATLETLGKDGRIENATIVVRDGKVEAVGSGIEIPTDARIVPMDGRTILPGLVDPYYVFTVREQPDIPDNIPEQFRNRFRGRGRTAVTTGPFVRVSEYFYPYDTEFDPAIRSGITSANLVASGQGQSAFAWLRPEDGKGMIFEADGLLFLAVTNSSQSLDILRNGLDPNQGGANRRGAFGGRGGRGGFAGRGGRGGGGRGDATPQREGGEEQEEQPEESSQTEKLWKSVRDGERPLILNANNAAGVLHALRATAPYEKVRLAIVSTGSNLYELLDQLAGRHVTLILQPGLERVPYTTELMNVAAMAHEKEIPFVFSLSLNGNQLSRSQDDPFFPIAMLVKSGLPRDAALRALTAGPAALLGLEEKLGSLEKGKLANMLVFDGDPLETGSHLQEVIVEGSPVHEF